MHDEKKKPRENTAKRALNERLGVGDQSAIAACACLGLAFLFSGIWLGDRLFVANLNRTVAVMSMRTFSLVVYVAVTLCIVFLIHERGRGLRRLFSISAAVALAVYIGALLYVFVVQGGPVGSALDYFMFFLTKWVGAPLTIALVCLFSRLERDLIIRMSALGMLGAFIIYIALGRAFNGGLIDTYIAMAISIALLVASAILCSIGMGDKAKLSEEEHADTIVAYGVVKMHWRTVLTPSRIIIIIFSATMLGYLRNGYSFGDAHDLTVSIAVLLALVVAAFVWKGLRIEHIFEIALFCSAAGLLLFPIFDHFQQGSAAMVYGLGTALFEVVVWVLAARLARNSFEMLLVATLARTLTVLGHLLGSLVVLFGYGLVGDSYEAITVSGLLLMFSCVLVLLYMLHSPQSFSLFMRVEEPETILIPEGYGPMVPLQAEAQVMAAAATNSREKSIDAAGDVDAAASDAVEDPRESYWTRPCDVVAKAYKLTAREGEVLVELAHGYTMAVMEGHLFISHNTMKMHLRHIYTKLDVHSRQEVIDIVEQVRKQN